MSGSANAGTTAERQQMRAKDLDREVRALASAPGPRVFFLDRRLTWMSVSHTMHSSGAWKGLCVPHVGGISPEHP